MNTNTNNPIDFSDLDSLDGKKGVSTLTPQESVDHWHEKGNQSAQGAIYEEKCKDCRGTGNFHSYSGRLVGPCFKCKGTGVMKFKTSPEQREKNRVVAAAKKDAKAEARAAAATQWIESHKAVYGFLVTNSSWSEFYANLLSAIAQYGSLTPNQLAAVEKAMAKKAAKVEAAPTVKAIIAAFDAARASGLKRPKLVFGDVALSQAAPNSRNPGMVYVKYQGEYAGKITTDGSFLAVYKCPAPVAALVKELSEGDLLAQAKAYGIKTGQCCCCGRELTDPVSVANGIGPICESNWF